MDKKFLSKLHCELITNVDYDNMGAKELLLAGNSFLKQYKQAKAILRQLTEQDASEELAHWSFVADFLHAEIEKVIKAIDTESQVNLEDFNNSLLIKFADLVASARIATWEQPTLDKQAQKTEPAKQPDIKLILE